MAIQGETFQTIPRIHSFCAPASFCSYFFALLQLYATAALLSHVRLCSPVSLHSRFFALPLLCTPTSLRFRFLTLPLLYPHDSLRSCYFAHLLTFFLFLLFALRLCAPACFQFHCFSNFWIRSYTSIWSTFLRSFSVNATAICKAFLILKMRRLRPLSLGG